MVEPATFAHSKYGRANKVDLHNLGKLARSHGRVGYIRSLMVDLYQSSNLGVIDEEAQADIPNTIAHAQGPSGHLCFIRDTKMTSDTK